MHVEINIDGTGICNADSGIPFLDHMLDVRRPGGRPFPGPNTLLGQRPRQRDHRHNMHIVSSLCAPRNAHRRGLTGCPRVLCVVQQIASHGLFDVTVKAKGDTHIDDHHTNEDIGLAFGQASFCGHASLAAAASFSCHSATDSVPSKPGPFASARRPERDPPLWGLFCATRRGSHPRRVGACAAL